MLVNVKIVNILNVKEIL